MAKTKNKVNVARIAWCFNALLLFEYIAVQFDYTQSAIAFRAFEEGSSIEIRPISDVFPIDFDEVCVVHASGGKEFLASKGVNLSLIGNIHWALDDLGATYSSYWMIVLVKRGKVADIISSNSSFSGAGKGNCYIAKSTSLVRKKRGQIDFIDSDREGK